VLQSEAPHANPAPQREHRVAGHWAARLAASDTLRASMRARRAGNSAAIATRRSGVNSIQCSISANVRPHPMQVCVAASSVQTLVQGESRERPSIATV
jgi:hypothetical protein